jgi:hypothetical protein
VLRPELDQVAARQLGHDDRVVGQTAGVPPVVADGDDLDPHAFAVVHPPANLTRGTGEKQLHIAPDRESAPIFESWDEEGARGRGMTRFGVCEPEAGGWHPVIMSPGRSFR